MKTEFNDKFLFRAIITVLASSACISVHIIMESDTKGKRVSRLFHEAIAEYQNSQNLWILGIFLSCLGIE